MAEVKDAPKTAGNGPKAQTPDVTGGTATPAPAARPGNPFEFMRRFGEEMDRLFEEFGMNTGWRLPSMLSRGHELIRREAGLIPAEWSPRVDILRADGQFVVRADLPGLAADDIKVEVSDDAVTISGERKEEKKERREGYSYNECAYGTFFRAVPLPEGVDGSKATAEFRDGVLRVVMPAPEPAEPRPRRLEIKAGQ